MVDQFKETKTITPQSVKSKFSSACGGIVIGIALFIGAFAVLYSNEGSVDLSNIARGATDIEAATLNTEADGELVDTTGKITSNEVLGDNLFLAAGKYIALNRKVEMYAWVEEVSTETDSNNTETTTYDYTKSWVEAVGDSSKFKYPADHTNPAKKYENERKTVSVAQVGVYQIELVDVTLPDFKKLALTQEKVTLSNGATLANGEYLFIGSTNLVTNTTTNIDAPQVGDLRISYSVLEPDTTVTVFGRLDSSSITQYIDEDNNKLFRIFSGNKDAALSEMHGEYTFSLWATRVVGFLMMWIGLSLLFGPIVALSDMIPVVGKIGKSIIGAITFVLALALTVLTIVVSAILHNTLLLIVIAGLITVVVVLVAFFFIKKKK